MMLATLQRCNCSAAVLAMLVGFAGEPRAQVTTVGCGNTNVSCTLAELTAGATIQVDDKLFSSWQIEVDPGTVNFGNVDVEGIPGAAPGLVFRGNGELVVSGSDFLDLRFGYIVTVTDPQDSMIGNKLQIVSDSVLGTGRLSLEEAVFALPFSGIGVKSTEVDPLFAVTNRQDVIEFAPQQSLFIEKEIFLEGIAAADFAELDEFSQSYIQVPEPHALLQLAAGAAFLVVAYSRRRLGSAR